MVKVIDKCPNCLYNESMGIDVKTLRKQKGLTQSELASLLKCDIKSIQRYEAGITSPRRVYFDILERIGAGEMDNAIKELKTGNGHKDVKDEPPLKQDVNKTSKTTTRRHKQDDIKTSKTGQDVTPPFNPCPKPHSKPARKSAKVEVLSGTD